MTVQKPPELSYSALPVPWYRRRQVQKFLLVVAALTLMVTVWNVGPSAWRDIRYRFWLHRCSSYTAPPDQVVYEDDLPAPSVVWEDSQPAAITPSVESTHPQVMTRAIRAWEKLRGTQGGPDGILFMHGRTDPSGKKWLVVVKIESRSLEHLVISRFLFSPDRRSMSFGSWLVGAEGIGTQKLKIYAGRADPSDSGRFEIPFELGGHKGTIIGRLQGLHIVSLNFQFNSTAAGEGS